MAETYLNLKKENALLKAGLADCAMQLEQSEKARDHLRQQANELKGVCLALVRMLKLAAAEATVTDEEIDQLREQEIYSAAQREPIRITKSAWEAATSSEEAKAGKGVVLLVMPQENGDYLIDLGDVEKEPEAPAQGAP